MSMNKYAINTKEIPKGNIDLEVLSLITLSAFNKKTFFTFLYGYLS